MSKALKPQVLVCAKTWSRENMAFKEVTCSFPRWEEMSFGKGQIIEEGVYFDFSNI